MKKHLIQLSAWARHEWPTIGVIILGISAQLFLVTRSIDFLFDNVLPDDAFYYFGVASNIAQGLGPTFDGLNATNGYHPLWMLVLVLLFKFAAGSAPLITPIKAALLLQVAMNAVTAFLVARVLARFTASTWTRSFGMVIWMLNPFLLYETLNGLETSLALLLFAFFFMLALRVEEGKPIGGHWFIGIVGGCMTLARLDMGLYVFVFLVWILARHGWKNGWPKAALSSAFAAFPVLPYFAWNLFNFRMLLTSSSGAETLINHVLIVQDHGTSTFQFLKAIIYNSQYELDYFFRSTGMYSLGAGFIGAFSALSLTGSIRIPRRLREIPVALALFTGFVLLFIADASIRWTARSWYFVSFEMFLSILVVIVADILFRNINYKRTSASILLALVLFSFYVDWSKNLRTVNNERAGQKTLRDAAEWMNENLPKGAVRGSFTAGIQGYFSTSPLIDLDGLVSNTAYAAMKKRELWDFIEKNVEYLSVYDNHFTYRYKSVFGIDDPLARLKFIAEIPGTGGLKIYQVR